MIHRFQDFHWEGTEQTTYKDEPGTWLKVTKCVLSPSQMSQFESRYFEVAPGGYTSFEMHQHEHFVMVVRGSGRVRIGEDWNELGTFDVVSIAGNTPHQFANDTSEPFGIVCIVDKNRDVPILLDPDGTVRASNE